jgi:dissimilatory sulfite reductase (desulfoviridin) alpha/beta subunit
MKMAIIDYDALKKRGFLKSRHEGYVTLRTRMPAGNYESSHLKKIALIAEKYGNGITHLTTRQGIEVPYIKFEDIERVEHECAEADIQPGTSGPRVRATTCCPGNNWCQRGLVDTFSLFKKIEQKGIKCALDLPHKFKIAISGCPNTCTRAQVSDIGIHGQVDTSNPQNKIGYAVYLGGSGGRTLRTGFKLEKTFTEDEVLSIIEKVVTFYKENAKPRQRLALLIEEIGRGNFLKRIGVAQ